MLFDKSYHNTCICLTSKLSSSTASNQVLAWAWKQHFLYSVDLIGKFIESLQREQRSTCVVCHCGRTIVSLALLHVLLVEDKVS